MNVREKKRFSLSFSSIKIVQKIVLIFMLLLINTVPNYVYDELLFQLLPVQIVAAF